MPKSIKVDTTNYSSLIRLMNEYGESTTSYFHEDPETGEIKRLSISKENIIIEHYQNNGRTLISTYWRDGVIEERYEH